MLRSDMIRRKLCGRLAARREDLMVPTDEDVKSGPPAENDVAAQADKPQPGDSAPSDEVGPKAPPDVEELADEAGTDSETTDEVPPSRLYRFARKLMDRRELAEDTRELMVAFLSTSDRAKTEMVKMAAREVRTYLEELKLKDDVLSLVRNHSLEVNASFSLKPIEAALKSDPKDGGEG